jgi:hypothetical protein
LTTAPQTPAFMDFEVPEQLPERSSEAVYRVLAAGAQLPPARMSAKSNNTHLHFHMVMDPLSFRYDSDLSLFEDNFEQVWAPIYDRNGKLQGPDSNFGEIKEAFLAIGYPITNAASAQALVGKTFLFRNRKKTRTFKKADASGNTTEDSRDTWLLLPVEEIANYEPSGVVPTVTRGKKAAVPSAANVPDNAAVALPILKQLLEGKREDEYFATIMGSGNPEVSKAPYIVEASTDPKALTARLQAIGMRQIDGRLVN